MYFFLNLNIVVLCVLQLLDAFGHKSNISLVFDFMETDLEVSRDLNTNVEEFHTQRLCILKKNIHFSISLCVWVGVKGVDDG